MTRKAHNVDKQRTAAAHFLDTGGPKGTCRSYWTHAGHEYLFGDDARLRRQEIYDRDKGICQKCKKFAGWHGHLHHIKGGNTDDRCWCPHNLEWTHADCHLAEHVQVRFGKEN